MIKLTKEQEEAIEIFDGLKRNKEIIKDIDKDYFFTFAETIINMVQEQQKENEKKDKIIDLMADFFNKRSWKEHQIKDEICLCCTTEFGDEDCKDCIKQYFENQAKM